MLERIPTSTRRRSSASKYFPLAAMAFARIGDKYSRAGFFYRRTAMDLGAVLVLGALAGVCAWALASVLERIAELTDGE